MSYNIIFNNFEENDFSSKGAKVNMKKFIKKHFTIENISKIDNTFKNEAISKYLKFDNDNVLQISHKFKDNDLNLFLVKKTLEQIKNEEKRNTIRNKIDEINKPKLTQRQAIKLNKKKLKEIKEDERITNNMVHMYYRACQVIDNVPKPKEILDNKPKYVDEIFKHLLFLCNKSETKEQLIQLMNNNYINYLQAMCQINYMSYLDTFFKKIYENSSNESSIPLLIKNEFLKKNEQLNVPENITSKMIDSDDES